MESATVITDRYSGQSRGFGFVEMATNEEAQKAVSMHNGQRLDGRTIKVEVANPQGAGGGGRGGSGMGGGAEDRADPPLVDSAVSPPIALARVPAGNRAQPRASHPAAEWAARSVSARCGWCLLR